MTRHISNIFLINVSYRQIFKLISVKDTANKISTKDLHPKVLQHELPGADFTQGRSILGKRFIFKMVSYYYI